MVSLCHVGDPFRDRCFARRPCRRRGAGHCSRARVDAVPCRNLGVGRHDPTSPAGDRQASARTVWPEFRTQHPADRTADACSALVVCCVEGRGQFADFLLRQEPLPFVLDPLLEGRRRIVGAPAPADGKGEHLAQDLPHPVGADRGRLGPLQLVRPVVGLFLGRARAALGDDVQQFRHIMRRDLGHQFGRPVRCHQLGEHRLLVRSVCLGQMRHMLGQIAVDHVAEPRGFAQLAPLAEGVAALVDFATHILGPVARGRHRPLRPASDGHPALPPGEPVIQRESPAARPEDADGKAAHLGVEHLVVARLLRFTFPDRFIVQSQTLEHG